MTKKILLLIILMLIFATACGNLKTQKGSTTEIIKVGVTTPLTGDMAYLGNSLKNGLLLALEDIEKSNPEANKKLELVIEDNKGEAGLAVTNSQYFIDLEKIQYILTYPNSACVSVSPLVKEKNILQIALTMDHNVAINNPQTITIYPTTAKESSLMVDYIMKHKLQKIAFLYSNVPAHQHAVEEYILPEIIKDEEFDYLIEKFEMSDKDIQTQMLKIKDNQPDILIAFMYPFQTDMFLKTLYALEMDTMSTLGNLSFSLPSEIQMPEGLLFTSLPAYLDPPDKVKQLATRYENRFGQEMEISLVTSAYDSLMLLWQAMLKTDGKIESVKQALIKVKDYQGISGQITIPESGLANVEMIMGVVKNSEKVKLD